MKTLLLLAMVASAGIAHAQTYLGQWPANRAYDIAISPDNIVYVGAGYLRRYTTDGTLLPEGWNPQWTDDAAAFAIAPDGNVWETRQLTAATGYNFDGSVVLGSWIMLDWTSHHEPSPGGIAVDALGRVCMLSNDLDKTRIEVRSQASAPITVYFTTPGQGLAADQLGNLYVNDSEEHQIVEYSSSGAEVRRWGSAGSGPGQFNGSAGIAVAPDGNVYVVDAGNYRVQIFTPEGAYVSQFGSEGTGDGQFTNAYSIAIGADGVAYVTDAGTRVEKFGALPTAALTTSWGGLKARYR